MKFRLLPLAAVLPLTLLLSGCLGDVMEVFCDNAPAQMMGDGEGDADHCYQAAAIQEGKADGCENVEGKRFTGSNPPKDKCFLEIAENTGDISVCKRIEGGFMSYTQEECERNTLRTNGPEDCVGSENEDACRQAYGEAGRGCGEGYIYNINKHACHVAETASSSSEADSDDGIDSKVKEDLKTIGDAAKGKYMDLLGKAIESETDPGKLDGLQAYKEFLEKAGDKIDSAQASWDKMEKLKKIFLDSYDSSMDIDKMPVDKILEKGLFDRIKDRLFSGKEETPQQKEVSAADDALSVYEAMLKRQADIDYLKKDKLSRLKDEVSSAVQEDLTGRVTEPVKEIVADIAGHGMIAVSIVDHALTSFQETAKKEAFLDLAKAYNRRRDDLAQKHPDWTPEKLHETTVAQVKEDPYQDNTNTGFVKFGNILENKDCQDVGQPLCIDNRVWWTAMDKTYQHAKK